MNKRDFLNLGVTDLLNKAVAERFKENTKKCPTPDQRCISTS